MPPCPNCEQPLSPSAPLCPKCGHPVIIRAVRNRLRSACRNTIAHLCAVTGAAASRIQTARAVRRAAKAARRQRPRKHAPEHPAQTFSAAYSIILIIAILIGLWAGSRFKPY